MKFDDLTDGRVLVGKKWNSKEQYLLYLQHLARYTFSTKYVQNRNVLEIGCGTGYGTDYLAKYASNVTGIDVSKKAIEYCKKTYKKNNLDFFNVDDIFLPFEDDTFDICISFEVIEHIENEKVIIWLEEIKRVIKDNGLFILSTPNRKLRLLPFQKPWNPRHLREYSYEEFKNILNNVFSDVKIYSLYGNKEVQAIEERRVKQKPLKVFIIRPLSKFLSSYLPPSIKSRVHSFMKSKQEKNTHLFLETDQYSVNDFKIEEGEIKNCIGFYTICKN